MLTSMIHYIQWKICLNMAGTDSQLIISTISIHVCWSFVKVCPNKSARPRNICRVCVNNNDINKRCTTRREIKGLWGSETPIAAMVDGATCTLRSKNATFLIKQNTLNSIFPQTQKIPRKTWLQLTDFMLKLRLCFYLLSLCLYPNLTWLCKHAPLHGRQELRM